MKKTIIKALFVFILLVFPIKVYATNVGLLFGVGLWDEISGNSDDTIYLQGGLNIVQPFAKNSAIGFDYSIDYIGAESDVEEDSYTSHFSIIYRYYPGNYITKKTPIQTFEPFLTIAPSMLYVDHEEFAPGFEMQIGFDIIYDDSFLLNPFSLISYPMSKISRTSQLLTLTVTGAIYFADNNKKIIQKGIKIYSGTFF